MTLTLTAMVGLVVAEGGVGQQRAGASADTSYVSRHCDDFDSATEYCLPGKGAPTQGGGGTGKVSHKGWPNNNGVYWKVFGNGRGKHAFTGGALNDELLGHHGSDTIFGGAGSDILWADWDPKGNSTAQRDSIVGADGNDWIYSSHGTNRLSGGAGNDHIIAYYGKGTIDCGAGTRDRVQRRTSPMTYSVRNCEIVKGF